MTNKPTVQEMLAFLAIKIAECEHSIECREQAEKIARNATDLEWLGATRLHPSTMRRPVMGKAERMIQADCEARIAAKHREELEMLHAVFDVIDTHPPKG